MPDVVDSSSQTDENDIAPTNTTTILSANSDKGPTLEVVPAATSQPRATPPSPPRIPIVQTLSVKDLRESELMNEPYNLSALPSGVLFNRRSISVAADHPQPKYLAPTGQMSMYLPPPPSLPPPPPPSPLRKSYSLPPTPVTFAVPQSINLDSSSSTSPHRRRCTMQTPALTLGSTRPDVPAADPFLACPSQLSSYIALTSSLSSLPGSSSPPPLSTLTGEPLRSSFPMRQRKLNYQANQHPSTVMQQPPQPPYRARRHKPEPTQTSFRKASTILYPTPTYPTRASQKTSNPTEHPDNATFMTTYNEHPSRTKEG